jgi:hypothetical protein
MSKISKILFIVAAVLPFLAYAVLRYGYEREAKQVPAGLPEEQWHDILSHFHSTGYYNNWDIIFIALILTSFACIICAVLFWNRDKPSHNQKLFSD